MDWQRDRDGGADPPVHLEPQQPDADRLRGRVQQDEDIPVDRGLRCSQEAQRVTVL